MSTRRSYLYAYIRPEDDDFGDAGTPYYIGEGVDDRINQPHNNRKSGEVKLPPPEYRVMVAEGLTKKEAQDIEADLIERYGRICDGSGILENISRRGFSSLGMRHTAEAKRRMSEKKKGQNAGEEHWRTQAVVTLRPDPETGGLIEERWISLTEVSQKLSIGVSQLSAVARGEVRSAVGVRVYFLSDLQKGIRRCDDLPRLPYVVCQSPEGELFWITNLSAFCNERGLSQAVAANCLSGQPRTHQLWQFWREEDWALIHPVVRSGQEVFDEGLQNNIDSSARPYCLRDPAGEIHSGTNMRLFAKEQGLPYSALANMVCGISDSCRGWTRGDEEPTRPVYLVISPEGERKLVEPTIHEFAISHGIDSSSFSKMLRGKLNHTRGWRLEGNPAPPFPMLISPDGERVEVSPSNAAFAARYGLDNSSVGKLVKGKIEAYKGWRLAEATVTG